MQGDTCEFIDIYDDNISYYIRCEHLARYIYASEQVRKRKAKFVLDVSCGSGFGSAELSKYAHKVIAIDKNAPFECYKKENIEFLNIDLDESSLEKSLNINKKLDAVVCFETLEHLKNPEKLLLSLSNIIKKTGLLFVSVPNSEYEKTDQNNKSQNPFHLHIFTEDEAVSLIEKCGFTAKRTLYQSSSAQLYRNEARAIRDLKKDISFAKEMYPSTKDIHYYSRVFAWPDENKGPSYSIMFMCERKY